MAKAKQSAESELKALKAENLRLKRQLNTQMSTNIKNNGWRTATIVVLAGITGAVLISGNLLFWTARTVIETDKYHDTAQAIIEEPAVQKAIADKTTDAIFERVDTEQLLEENLPPRVQFAAPTLATQIETFTKDKARQVTSSEEFQDVWVDVNVKAHDRFISAIRESEGDGTVNISDVYSKLTQQLEGTKLSFLQNVKLPDNIGSIQVLDAPWLPSARYVVVNLDALRIATVSLFIILTAVIIYISRHRRKIALKLGVFYALLMVATLISVRITRAIVVSKADPKYQDAVTAAYQAVFDPFVLQTVGIMALALAVVVVAWLIGPGKYAGKVRQSFNTLFANNIHGAIFGKKENAYTRWVGKYQAKLQWIAVAIAFVSLLVISVTVANIVWLALALLTVIAIIQISSAKK
ncbi:hypothetical protein HY004_03125 [Candidatus Saccharibacteria bacterium]|nr:hypothetical protein [Candidatus Saccharibacteria bacterium]